jgi:hypothetical protein
MHGPWIKVPKPDDSRGRPGPKITEIHDDDKAKSLGYPGGFVGGITLANVTVPALFASFGHTWYENGAYTVNFAKPVFDQEEVRVVWEEVEPDPGDKNKIHFWLERRNGEQTTFGWAAVGEQGGQRVTPPWERAAQKPADPEEDLLPEIKLGEEHEFEYSREKDVMIQQLGLLQDYNWWYRIASPWGDPILPPPEIAYMVMVGSAIAREGQQRSSRFRSFMDGGRELVVCGPLFSDRIYHILARTVEKGRTKRSVYFISEAFIDDEHGNRVAILRSRANHLIKDLIDKSDA